MKTYATKEIRNVAVVGHGHSGKTSLAEAMLFDGKATARLGQVDNDTSTLDYEPEEQKRRITIQTALAPLEWRKVKVNLLDTPGDGNFLVDTRATLAVADGAVVVVSAVDGVQVYTEKVWGMLDEVGIAARAVFVSKMDRERADFAAALADCKRSLSDRCVAVEIPIGGGDGTLGGVVDLLAMKAVRFSADGREARQEEIPAGLRPAADKARTDMVEAVAATDDKLLEKYLEQGALGDAEVEAGLRAAIARGALVPVLCGSATLNLGLQPLLDFLVGEFPSPADRPPWKGTDAGNDARTVELRADDAAPLALYAFKTLGSDIGKLTLCRVVSGKLATGAHLVDTTTQGKEHAGSIYVVTGKKRDAVPEASAGDIVALAKLKAVKTGHTLCADPHGGGHAHAELVRFPPPPVPQAIMRYAIHPKSKGDEDKLAAKLHDVIDEDIALRLERDPVSKHVLLAGMGQQHIEAAVDKLHRMGVEVELLPPKIPYLETIRGRADNVEGKHKKQTGGKGQFGVCYLDVEPLPRGAGFEFVDAIVGGAIPRQFISAVEKGIRDRMQRGVVAGYPVTDVKVTVTDGKYHDVDSDSRSFEIAGSKGFQAAFRQAKPVLLEPVMKVDVVVPDDAMGDVIGDVNSRRGRVLGMDARGKNQIIKAQVPMAEMLKYAADLRSITGGRGTFTVEFSHYEELAPNLAEKVIAEHKVAEEEE